MELGVCCIIFRGRLNNRAVLYLWQHGALFQNAPCNQIFFCRFAIIDCNHHICDPNSRNDPYFILRFGQNRDLSAQIVDVNSNKETLAK